jgi:hypothetical protein
MDQIDADELVHWMAYHKTSPLSKDRDDLNAAMIAQTVANCYSKRPLKIKDFVLQWGGKQMIRGDKMMTALKGFAEAFK